MGAVLSTKQTSAKTGKSVDTLKWLRYVGAGPAYFKLGRSVVYDEADVDAWIDEARRTTGTAARETAGAA